LPIVQNRIKLASFALFRTLYDKEQDIYTILNDFLKAIVKNQKKTEFTLLEITQELNKEYSFDVPRAVVRTALKKDKFFTIKHSRYYVNKSFNLNIVDDLDSTQEKVKSTNEFIIEKLFSFIKTNEKRTLKQNEKEDIIECFTKFLVTDTGHNGSYSKEISTFVLDNKDAEFQSNLKIIKEGVILYTSLCTENTTSYNGKWEKPLTLYLDTEILFHCAGYNGETFQQLFQDFNKLVHDVNSKYPKNIQLKYFQQTKKEVYGFFEIAKGCIKSQSTPTERSTALISILDDCSSESEVITKRESFFSMLSKIGIEEDKKEDYLEEKTHAFNMFGVEEIKQLALNYSGTFEEIEKYTKPLNSINILRQLKENTEQSIEKSEYIFVSDTGKVVNMANDPMVKDVKLPPLALTMTYLTSRFWFNLNKSLGSSNFPKSMDVITKAQIVLSSTWNKHLTSVYEDLVEKHKDKELTDDEFQRSVAALKSDRHKPEDIDNENALYVLSAIDEGADGYQRYVEEHSIYKQMAQDNKSALDEARQVLEDTQNEMVSTKAKLKESEEKKAQYKKINEELRKENEQEFSRLKKQKDAVEKKVAKREKRTSIFFAIVCIILLSIIGIIVKKVDWNILEPIKAYIEIVLVVIGVVFLVFGYKKKPDILDLKYNYIQRYRKKVVSEIVFDEERYIELEKKLILISSTDS